MNAHGALAEAEGIDKQLKANTRKTRVINLLRMGYYFIKHHGEQIQWAVEVMAQMVKRKREPNRG